MSAGGAKINEGKAEAEAETVAEDEGLAGEPIGRWSSEDEESLDFESSDSESSDSESLDSESTRASGSAPLFGTEMTFTNAELVQVHRGVGMLGHNEPLAEALSSVCGRWAQIIMELSKSEGVTLEKEECQEIDGTRFKFPDDEPFGGWWFILRDDRPCIELSTKPASADQYKAILPYVQSFVFDAAAEAGLFPDPNWGAGHIHIDAETGFEGNPAKLLNFMTGINNMGIWPFQNSRMMRKQSTPLGSDHKKHNEEARKRYLEVVLAERQKLEPQRQPAKEDRGLQILNRRDPFAEIQDSDGGSNDGSAILALMNHIQDHVYSQNPKYQMLNTSKAMGNRYSAATLEIRAFDAQNSAADLLLQLRLLEAALSDTPGDQIQSYTPREVDYQYDPALRAMRLSDGTIKALVPGIVEYFTKLKADLSEYVHMMPVELQDPVMAHAKLHQPNHPPRARKELMRPDSEIERQFRIGSAPGTGNNCLLHTLYELRNRSGYLGAGKEKMTEEDEAEAAEKGKEKMTEEDEAEAAEKGKEKMTTMMEAAVREMRERLVEFRLVKDGREMIDLYSVAGNGVVSALGLQLQVHQVIDSQVLVHPPIGDPSKPLQHVLHRGLHFMPLWPREDPTEIEHQES